MSNVYTFTPRHELQFEKNLSDFIGLGRRLPKLNTDYDYDSYYWNKVGNFTVFGVSNQDRDTNNLLDESLIPFAKAYISYGNNRKAAITVKFYALRAINAACTVSYGTVDITRLSARDLDKATDVIRKVLSEGAAYQAGRGLKNLLNFLIVHLLEVQNHFIFDLIVFTKKK